MNTPTPNRSQTTQTKTAETLPAKQDADLERLLLQDLRTEVRYVPVGTDESIKLSIPLILKYIAVPAKDKQTGAEILPDEIQCAKFLLLCRARRLNPFEGDSFMVPFWDGRMGRYQWSLITAHSAYLKRAELHPAFDGMESGVIVQDSDGSIQYRDGDFAFPGDKILGGWANVYTKNHSHPKKSRVSLDTYKKGFGVWLNDEAGMICKCAEAGGLRDSFPTLLGGLYLREEMLNLHDDPAPDAKRPTAAAPAWQAPSRATTPAGKPQAPQGTVQSAPKGVNTPSAAPKPATEPAKGQPEAKKATVQTTVPVEKAKPKPQTTPAPEDDPQQGQPATPADDAADRAAGMGAEPAQPEQPEQPEPAEPAAAEPEPVDELANIEQPNEPAQPAGEFVPNPKDSAELQQVRRLLWSSGKTEDQLLVLLRQKKTARDDQKLGELATIKLKSIIQNWTGVIVKELK